MSDERPKGLVHDWGDPGPPPEKERAADRERILPALLPAPIESESPASAELQEQKEVEEVEEESAQTETEPAEVLEEPESTEVPSAVDAIPPHWDRPAPRPFQAEALGERFDKLGAEKIGIVGGKGVGKSYLFQSIVYRTFEGTQAGPVNYFLEKTNLLRAPDRRAEAQTAELTRFVRDYASWQRLDTTQGEKQQWYRLQLHLRSGLFGNHSNVLDIEFFDGSGESFFEGPLNLGDNLRIWREGFSDARVMIFCLPLWAAFPSSSLSAQDRNWRRDLLEGFGRGLQNYVDVCKPDQRPRPVRSILALTMADDDERCGLKTLYRRWIEPYLTAPFPYLKQLQHGGAIARYLTNARRVSEAMFEEFASSRDARVSSIPRRINFGTKPWLIPLSAIEGSRLDQLEKENPDSEDRGHAPVPVHVELPLLVALCENDNALM